MQSNLIFPDGNPLVNLLHNVDSCLVNKLESYSEETGVPLIECVQEALTLWLECIACVDLEELRKPDKPKLRLIKKNVH